MPVIDRKLPATTAAAAKLSLHSPPPHPTSSSFLNLRSPQSSINSSSTGSTPSELVLPGRPILPAAAGSMDSIRSTTTAKPSASNRKRKPMSTDEMVRYTHT